MYLKSIEINGFKSFANKIVFEFPQGITGIVGPNGSGKSNIGDAVRWVLGEQSAKQLRGSKMEDVIFSGTQNRKPMGFAYVAITFENSNRIIPLDYEEVTVARRVYRSGESEYLLNGSLCRRRDIVELFYDTGIGKEGYSIIGQGQVEKILSGKIEDSRELFDEAAGIAKYKKNRAVTQHSLEQERQNLERVTDILSELEKQVGPLEVQSQKAREYLKLRDEEKDLDLHLFLYDFDTLTEEQKEKERQLKIVAGDLEETRKRYEEIKGKNAYFQKQTEEITHRLEKEEENLNTEKEKREEIENQILILSHKIDSNLLLLSHYDEMEKENLEEEKKRATNLENLATEETEKQTVLLAKEKELQQLTFRLEEAQNEKTELEQKVNRENEQLFSIMNSSSDTKEKLGRYNALEEQLEIRNAEYNSRYLSFNTERKEYEKNVEILRGKKEEAFALYAKYETDYEKLLDQKADLEEKEGRGRREADQLNQDYLRACSRYETLFNIQENYEGYNQSIRRVMEQKKENPGIIGVVADIVSLPQKYETAIEIALGGALQNIVTTDSDVAKKMIGFLKKNRFGRATFLPLTNIRRKNSSISPAVLREEGVIGIASTLVTVEDRFLPLMESLLGRTVVVDTIDHALALSGKYHFTLRLVTLEGELLNPGGAITGGAFRHSGNLLGRKRELEEWKESMETSKERWKKVNENLTEIRKAKEQMIQQIEKDKQTLDDAALKLHDLENQIPVMEEKKKTLQNRIASLKEEHRVLISQMEEIREQKAKLLKNQEDNKQIHEKNTSVLDSLKRKLSELNDKIKELEKEKNDIFLASSKSRQELSFIKENRERIIKEKEVLEKTRKDKEQEKEKLQLDNQSYGKEKQILSENEKAIKKEVSRREDKISQIRKKRLSIVEEQNKIFTELENENEKLLTLEKEEGKISARQERIDEEINSRIDYMWENYELTYNQAVSQKRYEISQKEAGEYRKKKKEIKYSIKSLGNVNVNAIEEYKEVGERYEFMKSQYDDIKSAEEKLLGMIDELNEAMREQFTREFTSIRDTFTQVFQDLFEGGTASLELMDEENMLECGIRIIAQPPGKKLQNIMLLSGGERALTAIALLFAIQNLKPSPFCLLDEIEAALDDANIVRFSKYLKKLSKDTQFIVITHRRGTMNAADALYGITMQEKGISTLISVDLIDKDLK